VVSGLLNFGEQFASGQNWLNLGFRSRSWCHEDPKDLLPSEQRRVLSVAVRECYLHKSFRWGSLAELSLKLSRQNARVSALAHLSLALFVAVPESQP